MTLQNFPQINVQSNFSGSNIFETKEMCSSTCMGDSSHWGLVMAPGQEADLDNLGKSFRVFAQ